MKKLEWEKNHVLSAVTGYAAAMSLIDDDEEVTNIREGNNVFYLTVNKIERDNEKS